MAVTIGAGTPLSAILPQPPLEYDPAYFRAMVRTINFMTQQLQTPTYLLGNKLDVQDRDRDTMFQVNPQEFAGVLSFIMTNLPISTTGSALAGLGRGQVWIDNSTAGKLVLNITPWE